MSNEYLVAHFILQLIAILVTCKVFAYLGKCFFSQTEVVCEMLAGVVLGPSLFGYLAPSFQQWLFPAQNYILGNGQDVSNPSMSIIFVFGQIGLIFFMFVVGIEYSATTCPDS
jgi:Kef-type K+ transport system membrane component KefB